VLGNTRERSIAQEEWIGHSEKSRRKRNLFPLPYIEKSSWCGRLIRIYVRNHIDPSRIRCWWNFCSSVYTDWHLQHRADCNKEFASFLSPADPKKWPYLELAILKRNGVCDERYYAVIICVDYSRTLTTLRLSLSRCELEWVKRI